MDQNGFGEFETVWHDPADIAVNSVTDYCYFSYNGSTVTATWGCMDTRNWLDDGWAETYHYGPIVNLHAYSNAATESTWDEFQNSWWNNEFCGGTGLPTTVEYRPNQLTMYATGSDSGYADTWDYGCDSGLLSYSEILH
jgi:hypothetical protein